MKLQTGVARARMMFKKHLEWLPGFVFEPDSDWRQASTGSRKSSRQSQPAAAPGPTTSKFKWLYIANDYKIKEKQFTREDLRVAELAVKKLVIRFPRALPKIVDDVDRWQARMNSLLGMLKAWVHDDQPPKLEGQLNAGHFNERWLSQFRQTRRAHPKLTGLLNATAFLELTGQADPNPDTINWVAENAFALLLVSQCEHLSQTERLNLQFTCWQMREEMSAELLVSICRFISSEPAFNCPTKNQFTAIDHYIQSINRLRKQSAEQSDEPSTPELAYKMVCRQSEIGFEILSVLDSALHDKPRRRASKLRMLESFLTPEMGNRAVHFKQKLESDEKQHLRILRKLQSGLHWKSKSQLELAELAFDLKNCREETQPLQASVVAFKSALQQLQSSDLKPKNWIQLLPKIPEDIRCRVFHKWQEDIYDTGHKLADLDFFASQLGKLFAKRDLPESLKAHFTAFVEKRHAEDLVTEACETFEGNRKAHTATINLLSRLLDLPTQSITNNSYSALSSFAASTGDFEYLTSLIVMMGETERSFDEDEIRASIIFSSSIEHNCKLLKALDDSEATWEYTDALKDLKAFADYPVLKSAIAKLVLNKQISQLRKLQYVSSILKQFDLFGSCLQHFNLSRTKTDATLAAKRMDWLQRYPAKFHEPLLSLELTCDNAASIAESVLRTEFPNQAKMKAQIEPIKAKIASSETNPDLRSKLVMRLENLQKYLRRPEPVSAMRLENLHKKLEARADHEIIQRFIRISAELASTSLKQKFNVGLLIDKLLTSPYEMILAEILRLPKNDKKLGLRLLFETQGESTKCFDTEPANIAFVEKLPLQKNLWVNSGSGSAPKL